MKDDCGVILKCQGILFGWERFKDGELEETVKGLSIKMLRWMAMIHPDNRTRENLLRLSNLTIGRNTVINIGVNFYSNEEYIVDIGERCAIAANVAFVAESGPNLSELKTNALVRDKFIKKGRIIIEDDVWIGHGVVIFPGVRIGHHSIIGALTRIKLDIKPHTVIKGEEILSQRELPNPGSKQ
jgi:acetyltransferase-like isoleucine patch superfamily enzyme